jgi:hypothetical protein
VHLAAVEVSVHHDWLDYLAALGGLAGGLAGLVALVFAGLSKRDAGRSAAAAEAALAIMQRRAHPSVEIAVRAFGTSDTAPPAQVVLTLGFSNDGTRVAERVVVNVLVPDTLSLEPSADEYGNSLARKGLISMSPNEVMGAHTGAIYWADIVGPIDVGVHTPVYLRIQKPPAGDHALVVKLIHEDLPAELEVCRVLHIPESGGDVTLREVD